MLTNSLTGPTAIVKIKNGKSGVEYRKVGNFKGYAVGNDGSVWSRWRAGRNPYSKKWRQLALATHKTQGYSIVSLGAGNRKRVTFYVHILVLTAFTGPRPLGMEARHYPDRSTKNNHLNNLSWATPLDNALDKYKDKTMVIGEKVHTSKVTEKQVKKIIKRLNNGESRNQIANAFDVSYGIISCIANNKTWRHIPRNNSINTY